MLGRHETAVLCAVQRRASRSPAVVQGARALSLFGEHAAGWLALALVASVVGDRSRRRSWLLRAGGVAAAHGLSIVVKRVVRRQRPSDPRVRVLASTPSRLSFPSAHAASTTAAAVLFAGSRAGRLAVAVLPPMLLSRLVLGVHYPSDLVAGSVLGAAVGAGFRRRLRADRADGGGHR
ncbi:phosphatase PAP2 family protein [Lentzea sp. NPDC051208]|uniref:phosphatase PAP2 family protein n=1 Tax=Lentzea sp. NPDC051208 TaxID=3154642 RepID=UPI0034412E8C